VVVGRRLIKIFGSSQVMAAPDTLNPTPYTPIKLIASKGDVTHATKTSQGKVTGFEADAQGCLRVLVAVISPDAERTVKIPAQNLLLEDRYQRLKREKQDMMRAAQLEANQRARELVNMYKDREKAGPAHRSELPDGDQEEDEGVGRRQGASDGGGSGSFTEEWLCKVFRTIDLNKQGKIGHPDMAVRRP